MRSGARVPVTLGVVVAVLALSLSCGAPVSAPPDRAFYGLDEPHASLTREQALTAQLGVRPSVFSVFIRLDTTTTREKMHALHTAGLTPFVTLEPWHRDGRSGLPDPNDSLRQLASGAFDHQLLHQARMLATYPGTFYLRFAHEMNAPWYPWGLDANGNTAAGFVAAWRHVHALFDTVPGLHARWVWSPVVVDNPGASADLAALYPGDADVDYLGLTGYAHHGGDPAATFDATVALLRDVSDRPLILSEIGVDSAAKTQWLAALGGFVAARPDITGFVYFDTAPDTTGATGHYALTDPADRAAFAHTLTVLKGSTS